MSAFNLKGYSKILIAFVLCAHYAVADTTTTLHLSGFAPGPIKAVQEGVGADGTTWSLDFPTPTVTVTGSNYQFEGPATLVLGASEAHFTYINPTQGPGVAAYQNCYIDKDDQAICTDIDVVSGSGGYTSTQIVTTPATQYGLQSTGTVAASSTKSSGAMELKSMSFLSFAAVASLTAYVILA